MTKQHRATTEQWEHQDHWTRERRSSASCILELRARVEALEATQHAHVDTSHLTDAERKQIQEELASPSVDRILALQDQIRDGALTLADAVEEIGGAPIRSAPESPLVERVADAIAAQATSAGIVNDRPARAAILEVAAWLREQAPEPGPVGKWLGQISTPFEVMADMLRNEANR